MTNRSCDLEGLYKFLFPQPKEALNKFRYIWPSGVWEELTFKGFYFFSMGGHLVYRSGTILALLVGSHQGNTPMKFESHWLKGSRGVSF